MITPLPGHHRDEARLGHAPVPGRRGGGRRQGRRDRRGGRRLPDPAPPVAGRWRARSTRSPTATSRPTGRAGARTSTSSATPRRSTRTATSGSSGRTDDVINVSGHRMSTMEIESALVSHESVAEAAVIGQTDEDTGQAICAFVTLRGRRRPARGLRRRSCASTSRRRSASSRARSGSSGPTTCRRRARARSCAGCCKDIAEGRELGDVTTLRDPAVTEKIREKVATF